jgi:hypothetical protein
VALWIGGGCAAGIKDRQDDLGGPRINLLPRCFKLRTAQPVVMAIHGAAFGGGLNWPWLTLLALLLRGLDNRKQNSASFRELAELSVFPGWWALLKQLKCAPGAIRFLRLKRWPWD